MRTCRTGRGGVRRAAREVRQRPRSPALAGDRVHHLPRPAPTGAVGPDPGPVTELQLVPVDALRAAGAQDMAAAVPPAPVGALELEAVRPAQALAERHQAARLLRCERLVGTVGPESRVPVVRVRREGPADQEGTAHVMDGEQGRLLGHGEPAGAAHPVRRHGDRPVPPEHRQHRPGGRHPDHPGSLVPGPVRSGHRSCTRLRPRPLSPGLLRPLRLELLVHRLQFRPGQLLREAGGQGAAQGARHLRPGHRVDDAAQGRHRRTVEQGLQPGHGLLGPGHAAAPDGVEELADPVGHRPGDPLVARQQGHGRSGPPEPGRERSRQQARVDRPLQPGAEHRVGRQRGEVPLRPLAPEVDSQPRARVDHGDPGRQHGVQHVRVEGVVAVAGRVQGHRGARRPQPGAQPSHQVEEVRRQRLTGDPAAGRGRVLVHVREVADPAGQPAVRHHPAARHRLRRPAAGQQAQPRPAVGRPCGEDLHQPRRDRVRRRMGCQDRHRRGQQRVGHRLLAGHRQDRAHQPGDLLVPLPGRPGRGPHPAYEIRREVAGRAGPRRQERLQRRVCPGRLQRLGEKPLMGPELLGGHGPARREQQRVGPAVGGVHGQPVLGLGRPRRAVGPPGRATPVTDQPVAHGVPEPRQMRGRQLPCPRRHPVHEPAGLRPGPRQLGAHLGGEITGGPGSARVVGGRPVGVRGRGVRTGGGQQSHERGDHAFDRHMHH